MSVAVNEPPSHAAWKAFARTNAFRHFPNSLLSQLWNKREDCRDKLLCMISFVGRRGTTPDDPLIKSPRTSQTRRSRIPDSGIAREMGLGILR